MNERVSSDIESLRPEFWSSSDVGKWLKVNGFEHLIETFDYHDISGMVNVFVDFKAYFLYEAYHLLLNTGPALVMLTEQDLRKPPLSLKKLGEIKLLFAMIIKLQNAYNIKTRSLRKYTRAESVDDSIKDWKSGISNIPKNEALKLFVACLYGFLSLVVTSIAMTFVHDRVPDMQKIPPLPDIFLDNIPVIPRAFEAAEACAITLIILFSCVILVHKHRFTILRRYFSIVGTVFFLRALTMMSTTLSVPGNHLKMCQHRIGDSWERKVQHVLYIWTGMSLFSDRIVSSLKYVCFSVRYLSACDFRTHIQIK